MSLEIEILRDVTARFTRADIPFMLTGSLAMNAYTEPRMTRDMDLVIELDLASVPRLVAALAPDYYIDADAARRAVEHETLFNAIHREQVFKVDCIVRKNSAYRRLEFSRRRQATLRGVDTWVVSKEDLIVSKLCWGAPSGSDLQARDISKLLRGECDHAYIRHWAHELGVLPYLDLITDERHDA